MYYQCLSDVDWNQCMYDETARVNEGCWQPDKVHNSTGCKDVISMSDTSFCGPTAFLHLLHPTIIPSLKH